MGSGCQARLTTGRLRFDEWEQKLGQRVYVSATPSDYELTMLGRGGGGAVDPADGAGGSGGAGGAGDGAGAGADRGGEERAEQGERVMITTLTKRLAEDLSRT